VELWRTGRPVSAAEKDGVSLALDGEVLVASLRLEAGRGEKVAEGARRAYGRLLSVSRKAGYGHLLRIWNFVPGINQEEDGQERYRHFCYGRSLAFEEVYGPSFHRQLPAGTAVGACGSDLVVVLLASRHGNRHLSNPRQVDAYRYPSAYGPRSPSFSRATQASAHLGRILFLAGTASIVGHESRHPGRVDLQVQETLENLSALLGGGDSARTLSLLRVYVRFERDFETVREAIESYLRWPLPTLYLGADICRPELLVEIEGLATSQSSL
jgi:chorismate lyase/3-hydroxybenzoate synthase